MATSPATSSVGQHLDQYLDGRMSATALQRALVAVSWSDDTVADVASRRVADLVLLLMSEYDGDAMTRKTYLARIAQIRDDLAETGGRAPARSA